MLSEKSKVHRDRLVVLAFASMLLVLIYGPLAVWFFAADRFLYDIFASNAQSDPPENAVIISIDPDHKSQEEILTEYGRLLKILQAHNVRRVVLAEPPAMTADDAFPGWSVMLSGQLPIIVPANHRLADVANRTGVFMLRPDPDDVLRRSRLWHLEGGSLRPSLALATALTSPDFAADPRVRHSNFEIYHSNYAPVQRLASIDVLTGNVPPSEMNGKTIFVDAAPKLVSAVAVLPSGQFLTSSEITAQLLADIEQRRTIFSPVWSRAVEWLAPVLLVIIAALLLPNRNRRDIILIAIIVISTMVLMEALFLLIGRIRIDMGRAAFIFVSTSILSWWLADTVRKAAVNAFKRGSDFLAAGRLEPAFAEFRRCQPTETVATAMYKLSLAFEEQAKPERAEAVIKWMKKTRSGKSSPKNKFSFGGKKGAPQQLGRYVIERRLGRGAMGAVYLARDPRINRPVALKVIPIENEFEDEELEEARLRFFREAESAGRLTHPNIITVFDCGEDKQLAYIAMEYLQGISLTEFTDPKKLLAPNKALELCARTAEALDYAHNQGLIHRDIKPANLLYSRRQDLLKVSDFGLARVTDNNQTKTGILLGTPIYMSPEQLNAETLTGHSDLFSLGVTLYELMVGEVPFKASNIAVLMTKITTEDPSPVSNRRPGVPPSVDTVLSKALAKRPEDRFANGADMAIALRNCAKYAA
ncbi:MAG: protein kinase [Woeseiaceae bacterium]|nr:protein kinase [Woeseiaceae bacterium]